MPYKKLFFLAIREKGEIRQMLRIVILLIEEIGYLSMMVYASTRYQDRFDGVSVMAVFLIPAMAIALVNLLQYFLETKTKASWFKKFKDKGIWVYRLIPFPVLLLVFYTSFVALEYIGNMPASFRTLIILSTLSTTAHSILRSILGSLTTEENESQRDEMLLAPGDFNH